ncbi:MAG: outer membrane protein assembly factor BamD [Candidatus Zixiibacteriota bacterium]|nr:MAG: outer membrane protein assembly factor BamD [candidate division Zixibacteria bacterium]
MIRRNDAMKSMPVLLLICGMVLLAGCSPEPPHTAEGLMEEGRRALEEGDYTDAYEALTDLVNAFPQSDLASEAQYQICLMYTGVAQDDYRAKQACYIFMRDFAGRSDSVKVARVQAEMDRLFATRLEGGGLFMIILSWTMILALVVFCYWRIFRARANIQAPLEIDTEGD